jgi:hypothetical protein
MRRIVYPSPDIIMIIMTAKRLNKWTEEVARMKEIRMHTEFWLETSRRQKCK